MNSDRDRQRAKALKELLEANARWNQERRDAAKNDVRRIVDETGVINPELQKEMIYSWEKGFMGDIEVEHIHYPQKTILRKDPLRKSGQALTKQLKGKIATETDSTVKTTTGSICRKLDIAQAKLSLPHDKARSEIKSPSAEPNKKFQRISSPEVLEDIDLDDELRRAVEMTDFVNPVDRFQQSQTVVTSKDTVAGGGLSLAIKRAKPNTAGPSSMAGPKTQEEIAMKKGY